MIGHSVPTPGEEPILADLSAVGYDVGSLADLRDSGVRYREAVPVLVAWLGRVSDRRVKEQVVRALSVPWAKPFASQPLIREFTETTTTTDPTGSLRWAIGNALWVLFDDNHFEAFANLAVDRRYGEARQMVVLAWGKSKKPEAVDVLLSLVDDSDVDGHAVQALAKLKTLAARTAFESKLDDRRACVRNQARKGLTGLST